jgi:methylthioribose-1-phosphate isomerase
MVESPGAVTYLKALAAHDNGVPFYVALPSPTIDFSVDDGIKEILIEQRGAEEVTHMTGRTVRVTYGEWCLPTAHCVLPGAQWPEVCL